MRHRCAAWIRICSLTMGLALPTGVGARPALAEEGKATTPAGEEVKAGKTAESAAPAAAAATPAPDPTSSPTKPDATGASYTGATTGAALSKEGTGDAAKVTPASQLQDLKQLKIAVNTMWALLAGFLVMFMQAGFALLETGLCRAKNVAHTMAMNFVIYGVGLLAFWACGFAFQMGGVGAIGYFDGPKVLDQIWTMDIGGKAWGLLGHRGFFLSGMANDASVLTMFLFQMVFMDTAATIPTGAMAERWKFSAFIVYGIFIAGFLYPMYACWVWGGGWLANLGTNYGLGNGHIDFAGSSVVHMTGGMTALAGAIILGPRIGKFNKDGSANVIPCHNVAQVVLGTLILAFGWFGFNGGSTLAGNDLRISAVCVNTMLASAGGCMSAVFYMWAVYGKPDPTMGCNGLLAGLVAITAPCAFVSAPGAVIIGTMAGVLVIWAVLFVERVLKVDDPVGAVAVHGVNGAFGCICVGLFATGEYGGGYNAVADKVPTGLFYGGGVSQLVPQLIGVGANFLFVFPTALLFFFIVEKTMGNRVSARVEIEGLDIHEMGIAGYTMEETRTIEQAGHEHLSTYGPGVPKGTKNGHGTTPQVPTRTH